MEETAAAAKTWETMMSSKNSNSSTLWGELQPRETFKQEIITPDIIENVWRQVMDDANSTDCDYQINKPLQYIRLPLGNHHVLNTINFHQQLRSMEEGTVLGNLSIVEAEDGEETKTPWNPFKFLPIDTERTVFKNSSNIQHLTQQTAHNLLRHAVIVLLAHIGFEYASDLAIETLTDVADHFLRRMTLLLKVASEQGNDGFPDAMERVLLETGIGGIREIHDYYQEYILKFKENMQRKVEETMEKQRMVLDEAASKLQLDELDEFGNVYREVPTLQLLDPEMGFPPSLDAGFQMLYSLEQDELNSLEVEEEEAAVHDSPNVGKSDATAEKKNVNFS